MNEAVYTDFTAFYWSGTGNSFRVASWLQSEASEAGLETRLAPIEQARDGGGSLSGHRSMIAVVFPTHGFTAPWHVIRSVCKLPAGGGAHAFCVATRAGMRFGPLFVPGISGSATFIVALLLWLKGYRVRGIRGIDMPSNWFSFHPIQSRESHTAIIDRAELRTSDLAQRMLAGRHHWLTRNAIVECVWGVLLSLVSVGYLLMGRFFLAKLFFANVRCNGCGVCARTCSVGGITMRGKKHPRPYWRYNCESCMRCAAFCPENAIEAGHSWGVLVYFVTALPVSIYISAWLAGMIPGTSGLRGHWTGTLLDLLYFYPALFVTYAVFQLLLRVPAINWLFAHTNFTHLKRWGRYREPNVRLKQLSGK